MVLRNWWWVVIACMVVLTVHQIVKLSGENSVEPQSSELEQALEPDGQTMHTASIGELPSMSEEKRPPAIKPAKTEEPEQTSTAPAEDSEPGPEERGPDIAEPAETAKVAPAQAPPSPVTDQPVVETTPPTPAVVDLVESSNKGLVRGIVYSEEHGSALIDETVVQAGGIVDGVRVLRIHADGVDFERDGQKWTQKVSETPGPQWR